MDERQRAGRHQQLSFALRDHLNDFCLLLRPQLLDGVPPAKAPTICIIIRDQRVHLNPVTLVTQTERGSKPKSPKTPSPQLQPRHDRIQVDDLSVAAEGVVPVQVDVAAWPPGTAS